MADIEHKDIPDSGRHEPKGASTATAGHVLKSNGDGSTSFVDVATLVDVGNIKTETVLNAFSTAGSQQPSGTDVALQIEFGNAQNAGPDPVMIDNLGTITFNQGGNYRVRVTLQYGRTGTSSSAILHGRALADGVQVGNTISASVDTAGILISTSVDSWLNVTDGTELKYEIVRDSLGVDAGGLFASTPSIAGWNFSPSAAIVIDRVVTA